MLEVELKGKIKSGNTKTKKINGESVNFYQIKIECPIGEDELRKINSNASTLIFSQVPFPFEKIVFEQLKQTVKIKILQLDDENDPCGDEREFVDTIIKGYSFNAKNVPRIVFDFLIPTSKNLIEGLINMHNNVELKIEL